MNAFTFSTSWASFEHNPSIDNTITSVYEQPEAISIYWINLNQLEISRTMRNDIDLVELICVSVLCRIKGMSEGVVKSKTYLSCETSQVPRSLGGIPEVRQNFLSVTWSLTGPGVNLDLEGADDNWTRKCWPSPRLLAIRTLHWISLSRLSNANTTHKSWHIMPSVWDSLSKVKPMKTEDAIVLRFCTDLKA